jgi:hypothetical protein
VITRIVKVTVYVASAPGFTDQPLIANGTSQLPATSLATQASMLAARSVSRCCHLTPRSRSSWWLALALCQRFSRSDQLPMPSHSYDVLARLRPDVPAGMVERAARWSHDSVPSVATPAASVILLRDSESGLETYLLHRHALMPFAATMVVFSWRRVDLSDSETIGPDSSLRGP